MKLEAHIIAREEKGFGEPLFGACLEAVHPHADTVVLVDNECSQVIQDMYRQVVPKDKLLVVQVEGRKPFDELRNAGLAYGGEEGWIVYIDSDELWSKEIFEEAKIAAQAGYDICRVGLKHLVVAPCFLDSDVHHTHPRFVKKRPGLQFKGGLHEGPRVPGREAMLKTPHIHFGYCRPQWQIFLKKWMWYDYLYYGHLDNLKANFDKKPNNTPNNLWQGGKNLVPYDGPWHGLTELVQKCGMNQESWFAYLEQVEDYSFWQWWQQLAHKEGSWSATLEYVFERYFGIKL